MEPRKEGGAVAFHTIHSFKLGNPKRPSSTGLKRKSILLMGESTEGKGKEKRGEEREGEGGDEGEMKGKEGRHVAVVGGWGLSPFPPGSRRHPRNQVQVVTS